MKFLVKFSAIFFLLFFIAPPAVITRAYDLNPDVSLDIVETSGYNASLTIPEQGNRIIHYVVTVVNHGPGPVDVEKAAFTDPIANWQPTTLNLNQNIFQMTGKTHYEEGESGVVEFFYDTAQVSCGRVQIDGGLRDPQNGNFVFIGTMVNYGVDCEDPVPVPACDENASVAISGPSTLNPGQEGAFSVRVTNTGNTWFYHGNYFKLLQTSSLNINPSSFGLGIHTFDYTDYEFTLTAPTTPGVYTLSMQNMHFAGADYQLDNGIVCASAPSSNVPFGEEGTFTLTVNVPIPPAPTVTLTANPTSVAWNGSSTLTWTSTNATSCTASGDWTGTKATSGSELKSNLTSNKSYTITCTGLGGSATATATVSVGAEPIPVPTVTLTANPTSVAWNGSSTLTWTSTNATSCTASGDWTGTKATAGSEVRSNLTSNKSYIITCTGLGGSAVATANVTVGAQPIPAPTVSITANPTAVPFGGSSILIWTSTNTTSCVASVGWSGAKAISGSEVKSNLTSATTYTITCTGPGGTASDSANVGVGAEPVPPPTVTLTANPTSVAWDGSSTLTWTSTNATSCVASGSWSGIKALGGTEIRNNLTSNVNYVITCTGPGGTASATANVTVGAEPIPAPTVTLTANPTSVAWDGSSTLTWTSTNATSCTASGDWTGTKATSGSELRTNLTSNKSYTITCTGLGGSATATATVSVGDEPVNNRPVITLIGLTPITITVGTTYTDAGATAFDQEDGDITADIVATSTVNTAVVGSYTVTYNVSDSKGLAALPVTRVVNVVPVEENDFCLVPNMYTSSSAHITIGQSWDGSQYNLQNVLNNLGFSLDAVNNQVRYETWTPVKDNTIISIKSLFTKSSYTHVFGYYRNDGVFHPVYRNGDVPGYSGTPLWTEGQSSQLLITGKEPVTFAILVSNTDLFRFTKPSLNNPVNAEHTIVYNTSTALSQKFVVAFEDLPVVHVNAQGLGDQDYNDLIVEVISNECFNDVFNNRPVITLIGLTPITITVGTTYTDAGATAFDQEDGDITADIVVTSTVNTAVVGSYTVTYNVSDSKGLAALPVTRVVNVVPEVVQPSNNRPVITLIGANPASVYLGETYIDPGATAFDQEDGDITADIVATSTVNTAVVGSYTVTYNVADSKGLAAFPVSRTVNVLERTPEPKGKITFCLVLANHENVIATSSAGLPNGSFMINLASTTGFSTSTLQTQTWNTTTFSPDRKIILSQLNDADCYTYSDLNLGTYYYSELAVNGSLWNTPKYNDGYSQPINNVFDFYVYSPELFNSTTTDDSLRNMNSDGQLVLTSDSKEKVLVMYNTYDRAPQCVLPQITSSLTGRATTGSQFSYTFTATSSEAVLNVATSTLPLGLSFATSTNTISGVPTVSGIYNITLTAGNNCGVDTQTLVLTVEDAPSANLNITKTSDKASANTGDTITYTITLVNNGPSTATEVSVTDSISSLLNFVSASTTTGSFATSTGVWTVGSLLNGSSATMTLVATVKAGTEGQKITNTATATSTLPDPNGSDNTSTTETNVNTPTCTSNCGGGGGNTPSANLVVTKTADKTTLSVGDTITYTITVVNNGPDTATGVFVNDTLPNTLTFVSATSTLGSYSTTTSKWTIGDLKNASSTTLTIVATANAGTEGQKITNTAVGGATQNDPDSNNNTGKVDVNVNPIVNPPCTTNCGGGGGGGGGNGPIVGSYGGGGGGGVFTPVVVAPNSCYYLYDFLRKDFNNNPVEVRKLQVFLRDLEGFTTVQVTGVYDDQTIVALNAFQSRYMSDILTPWGHDAPTSYTYILTKKKVNEIYCKMAFPVTPLEQIEIDSYRNFLLGLKREGITLPRVNTTTPNTGENTIENTGEGSSEPEPVYLPIGSNTSSTTGTSSNLATLAGMSSTTQRWANALTANVLSAGKKMANVAWGVMLWPFGSFSEKFSGVAGQCKSAYLALGWLNMVLILAILVMAYLWYRQYQNNKKLENINKEIDLK